MLPDQKRAVRQWVFDALAVAGLPIPLDRITWSNQDAVTLDRPYVLLLATGSVRRGPAPEYKPQGVVGASSLDSRTDGTSTLSITVVGERNRTSLEQDAEHYTGELENHLQIPDLEAPLVAANLAVAAVTSLDNLDALTGQSQWETRAALDITFSVAAVVTTDPGAVQTVEVGGTTEPPAPVATREVSAP